MPIAALPPNAVRAIGSSQALSDSASVVKELLDNAIDGGANKISIDLSANTLDHIRVKDNGHGIAPDDRTMICTKYCTSKIRSYHDLENVGGRSLGFRGEALASAAELSGSLTITTRIEGECTAVELKFDREGQISGHTSHPVGTTVRVEKYLQNLPVRRQAAEKTTVKMLSKIKQMLQAYALARPHLRLSLKILKAKDRKGDWTYPKSGALSTSRLEASLHAATDIFGKKLTSQCNVTSSSWSITGEQMDEATSEESRPSASRDEVYTLEATMAKRDCDGSVVSNVGHYLSIDSRPVSCTRGTLQQVVSSYKSHLRSATTSKDNVKIWAPFLCLNITCPPRSYDANVEPAKDDVLFTNSESFLGIVESFFDKVYGKIQAAPSRPPTKNVSRLQPHGIEILLARKESPVDSAPVGISPIVGSTLPLPQSTPESNIRAQPLSHSLKTSAIDLSPVAPPRQDGVESCKTMRCADTEHSATHEAPKSARPSLLSHDPSTYVSTEGIGLKPTTNAIPDEAKPGWKGSMYAVDEEEEADLETRVQERPRSPVDLGLDGDEHLRDVEVSNPWAFAKLNAAMRSSGRNKQLHTPGRQLGDAGSSTDRSSDDFPQQADLPSLETPSPHFDQARSSPDTAYPTPSPFPFPLKARGKRKAEYASVNALSSVAPSNKEHQKRGALDTWVQKSPGGYDEVEGSPNMRQGDQGPPDLPYSRDFISAKSLALGGTPLSEIPDASQRTRRKPLPRKQQQGNIDRSFVPPVRDPNHVWFDIGDNLSLRRPGKSRPKNDHQDIAKAPPLILRDEETENDEADRPLPPMHPDLAITLDYEARKQKASEAHRKALHQQAAAASKAQTHAPNPLHPQHNATSSSPHKNRQAKAIAALHHASTNLSSEETTALDPSDPRAYLLRIHHQPAPDSQPKGKSRRQKTSMLPFESVTEENYVGDLTFLIQDVTIDDVEDDMKEGGVWDQYIQRGEDGNGFGKVDTGTTKRWEGTIKEMLREMYAEEDGGRANLDVDLLGKMQAHAVE